MRARFCWGSPSNERTCHAGVGQRYMEIYLPQAAKVIFFGRNRINYNAVVQRALPTGRPVCRNRHGFACINLGLLLRLHLRQKSLDTCTQCILHVQPRSSAHVRSTGTLISVHRSCSCQSHSPTSIVRLIHLPRKPQLQNVLTSHYSLS